MAQTNTVDFGLVIAGLSYERYDDSQPNKATYIATDEHSDTARSTMDLYRTAPRRQGDSLGVRKSAIKLTRDFAVPTADGIEGETNLVPAIVQVSWSLPVGLSDADRADLNDRIVTLVSELAPTNIDIEAFTVVGSV